MAEKIFATEGDMLDSVAWRHYGRTRDALPALIRANPDLVSSFRIPAGAVITLPDLPREPAEAGFRLW